MNTSFDRKASWGRRVIKSPYIIGASIVIIAVVIFVSLRGDSSQQIDSAPVVVADIIERVEVTGRISAVNRADLSFEKSGVISVVRKRVGDRVDAGELIASLNNADAEASLASAQAKLEDMTRGLRPEEMRLEQARVDAALVSLTNAEIDVINNVREAYVIAQSAFLNHADTFFNNAQSVNPTVVIPITQAVTATAFNASRVRVNDIFASWKQEIDAATTSASSDRLLTTSIRALDDIKAFLDVLALNVNTLTPASSGLSSAVISSYVSSISTAQTGLNQAIGLVAASKTALERSRSGYEEARSAFALKQAGSSVEAVRAQQATVASLQAALDKGRIVSPIDGIVTRAEPTVGEFVAAGSSMFVVMSDGIYRIEAYVPEADIAKVTVRDAAAVTLDAYGSAVIFKATVTAIDPAETIIEGVPTYKVTLYFDENDERIRSGMTANTEILTDRRDDALAVPTRAIIDESGGKAVRVLRPDGRGFDIMPITVGLKGSDGMTEVISGLSEGQRVVTYVK